jgi:transposase
MEKSTTDQSCQRPCDRSGEKKEISEQLVSERHAIDTGALVVLYLDECHLLWDDARGYTWGKANEPITIPMTNFRERQTYYGAIEQCSGEITCQPAHAGDGVSTVAFIELLRQKYPGKRLLLIWDGASYHKGQETRDYLQRMNKDTSAAQWSVTCLLFAPHAPEQNPMEDMWLKGKRFIRKHWWKCTTFRQVKALFMEAIHESHCIFEKLFMYAPFLEIN